MSKPRALIGLAILPLGLLARLVLMAVVFIWVLLADVLPADLDAVIEEWKR